MDHTTDPDTAASLDAAAVAFLKDFDRRHGYGKVWRDQPCDYCFEGDVYYSMIGPAQDCPQCSGTGRVWKPAE